MKSTEEYLNDYLNKFNELKDKNELWRLRVTPEDFFNEIQRIRDYGSEQRKFGVLTEDHIQGSENLMIEIALMDKLTLEEAKEQFEMLKKSELAFYKTDAPRVQKEIKNLQPPLKFKDTIAIYKGLLAQQITLEMIPEKVLEEFKKTRQFKIINRQKSIE